MIHVLYAILAIAVLVLTVTSIYKVGYNDACRKMAAFYGEQLVLYKAEMNQKIRNFERRSVSDKLSDLYSASTAIICFKEQENN